MRIYLSEETETAVNAAMEEWLLREPGGVAEPSMMLYVNRPAVLIGRNQILRSECNPEFCHDNGIVILRRISGGGTVYHDQGNLNLALVVPRQDYNPDAFTTVLTDVLSQLNTPDVTIDKFHSVFSGGRKLCGTAYALTSGGALMHGCILVDTDLSRLTLALTPEKPLVDGVSGVPSRRVPVTRLSDIVGKLTCEDVAALALSLAAKRHPGVEPLPLAAADLAGNESFQQYLAKFRDNAWNWRT
ncbi:MAG: lipoate--protein ligase family protein [Victivallales bacterium]|nr:lipoate--protein ligase family protein [Victivallales bacterium]